MTDGIDDSDIRRVDDNVDPTALTEREIEDAMPDDFSRSAKQAFAERVAKNRKAVRESVDLDKRITSSGKPQLRGPDGGFGPPVAKVQGTEINDNGEFRAQLDDGSTFLIDNVDLDAGSSGGRADNW